MNDGGSRLSIREISRRSGIPESTLRYYRNIFGDQIPTVGSGRRRRHPPRAIRVFKEISEHFEEGASRETIRRALQGGSRAEKEPSENAVTRGASDVTVSQAGESAISASGGRIDRLLAAMMVRDRELATMHRELLDLVGRLIRSVEKLSGAGDAPRADRGERADEGAEERPAREEAPSEAPQQEGVRAPSPAQIAALEELRERLNREQETVERLRRAKLELEQRLARAIRSGRSASR